MTEKQHLRSRLRTLRQDHVEALPSTAMALMFYRPPAPLVALTRPDMTIGLYAAKGAEAPTQSYAKWFHENGYPLALPCFEGQDSQMSFRSWADPYDEDALEQGPFGISQPRQSADEIAPDLVIVPIIGFTATRERLGQGGGHYDRWLANHPQTIPVGLAWDCQLIESLPLEPHDQPLTMVITQSRAYEGSA